VLTIGEMRARAGAFAREWAGETREDAERQTFWNEWFEVFGIRRRRRVTFEQNVRKLSGTTGQIDAFWPGMLLVEHKSAGEDLDAAMDQAQGYLNGLKDEELPRIIVLSDFARFRVHNLETDEETEFPLEEFAAHLELFTFLAGYRPRWFEDQDEVNVHAAELMGRLHDQLAATGYSGHELRVLLVRLVFLMFADDTGALGETGAFEDFVERKTAEDGSDLGPRLAELFQVLDTAVEERQSSLGEPLRQMPYVNGQLFEEPIPMAAFDTQMRLGLLLACRFNWSKISPAVFGSMFQSVMKPDERRAIGAHYTSEQNIMKVIRELFLDDLEDELAAAKDQRPRLRAFLQKLRGLTFFDPACGCGNFLVIAYREVRRLELEALKRLRDLDPKGNQLIIDASVKSEVDVDQFYGIEIEEFPCRIAEVAMYLADHQANQQLSEEFGLYYARFPLKSSAHIHNDNAVRVDWGDVLPASECAYLLGNPPFVGMSRMTEEQQQDRDAAFTDLGIAFGIHLAKHRTGRLDYVTSWYAKAWRYMCGHQVRAAFVSTNSITQGEQARSLGPLQREAGFHIDFAHRSFRWTSEARGAAVVTVVIIGFSEDPRRGTATLFDYAPGRSDPSERSAEAINWYLTDGPEVYPAKRQEPLVEGLPQATKGSQPTDGGHLIVTDNEFDGIQADPIASKYLRPFWQAKGLLHGQRRWCLWLEGATPTDLRESYLLRERVRKVAEVRRASNTKSVQDAAATPALFTQRRQPTTTYLAFPEVSSEFRRYIPAAYLDPNIIAGNKLIVWPNADLWLFGILQSSMFMAWVRALAGRMKNDISIAPDLTYSTFPFPDPGLRRAAIERAAQDVLDARASHPDSTLAELYDPLAMPKDLLDAHRKLDRETDVLYGRGSFDDVKRLGTLLRRYREMTGEDEAGPERRAA
jgi:hypothetical protein